MEYLKDPAIQPQPRRPRGFAATAAAAAAEASPNAPASAKGKREREKEKERTKLRERHRRAITSRMLAGLRQYGNFPLPARADMNDVLAALAREAGWTVEPDGTTYRHCPPPQQMVCFLSSLFFDYFIVGDKRVAYQIQFKIEIRGFYGEIKMHGIYS
ncbi:hypothetical protein SLEP1_g42894 [Rubroshorea leprosula]|uniref:Protein BZR1 homolog n=1 Tax=Rubroshorea leprosula TaxID=152421 RepID=A0AAV5LBB0_9ROSI|nr:hypothetical protein SLEP1_g42894 [Rubroshorea leprosula]